MQIDERRKELIIRLNIILIQINLKIILNIIFIH